MKILAFLKRHLGILIMAALIVAIISLAVSLFTLFITRDAINKESAAKGGPTCNFNSTINSAISSTYQLQTSGGWGTGFMVSDTYMITAAHVVEGEKNTPASMRPYFAYDGKWNYATIVNSDVAHDLALLKVDQPVNSYVDIYMNYKTGDEVYALGWPNNATPYGNASLSKGIISRILGSDDLKRANNAAPDDIGIIQTDTAVNPGNSGGPLLGECGVVGVISSKSDLGGLGQYGFGTSEQGINYAITSKTVRSLFGDYIKTNSIQD